MDTAIAVILKVTQGRLFLEPTLSQRVPQRPPAPAELPDLDTENELLIWKERKVLVRYLALFAANYADVGTALETKDSSALRTLMHKLKGAAAAVGLVRLAACAGQIEAAIQKEQPYSHLQGPLQVSLRRALDASQKLAAELLQAPNITKGDSTPVNLDQLREPLRQLYLAWDSREPDALEAHLAVLSNLLAAHSLAPLHAALTAFDFQAGKRGTRALASTLTITFQEH